jgi:hypothetical protein
MISKRRLASIAAGTLCALVLVMAPSASAEVRYYPGLYAYTGAELVASFGGTVYFDSAEEVRVTGHVADLDYDGWCALVSITANDGLANATTFRKEACGVQETEWVNRVFVKPRRLHNVKIAVGVRYPPTGQVRWGQSVKYGNPYR